MRLLVDSHVLLSWLLGAPKISQTAMQALAEPENEKFVSVGSLWELRIKQSIKKLPLPANFRQVVESQPVTILPVLINHADEVGRLPFHHRDPFDRMLVAQCHVEGLTLVTRDRELQAYPISTILA